jgi:hypothetical protein
LRQEYSGRIQPELRQERAIDAQIGLGR